MNKEFLTEFLCYHFGNSGITWKIIPTHVRTYICQPNEILFLVNTSFTYPMFQFEESNSKKIGYKIEFSRELTLTEIDVFKLSTNLIAD